MELCINPHNNLGEYRAERVNEHIADAGFTQGHKRLVPFIQSSIGYGDQERDDGPIEFPTVPFPPNAMKDSDTKDTELGNVCRLSNSEMH